MDGTLLDENSQLPEEFGEVLAKLKERGVTFVASSGRQYWSLLKSFDKYKEDKQNQLLRKKSEKLYQNQNNYLFSLIPKKA